MQSGDDELVVRFVDKIGEGSSKGDDIPHNAAHFKSNLL
jgi:hypothetical protein